MSSINSYQNIYSNTSNVSINQAGSNDENNNGGEDTKEELNENE